MSDKYFTASGDGPREHSINKRDRSIDAFLSDAKLPITSESLPDNSLTAGDPVAPETEPEAVEEGMVAPQPEATLYCSNCRLHLKEEQIVRQPINYPTNEDGTQSKIANRFSLFCKGCYKFLRVIDADAEKLLKDMIRKGLK